MSRATLKRSLGEAGAFFDDSNGADNLMKVLQALASSGEALTYFQATPTTGVKASVLADSPTYLSTLYIKAGTAGTASATTVAVLINGVSKATLTIDNAEADGTAKGVAVNLPLEAGDEVTLSVTAAATGVANLSATARLKPIAVEV
jgi:hypothetical protein